MKNVVILIIAAPATGKLTLAEKLKEHFKNTHVVDNHTVNNVFFKYMDIEQNIIDHNVFSYIKRAKDVLREFLAKEVPSGDNFIFTGCIDVNNKASYQRVVDFAEERAATFIPITIECDKEKLLERLDTPQRRKNLKLTCTEIFLDTIDDFTPLVSNHKNQITFNNSEHSQEETFKFAVDEITKLLKN